MTKNSEQPVVDFLYEIAKHARELGELKMPQLREAAGYNCETASEARQANQGRTRGDMIEEILIEEFLSDAERLDHQLHE